MLYDGEEADERLDVDGEMAMGTDADEDGGQDAFFGALLSRFGDRAAEDDSAPPIQPVPQPKTTRSSPPSTEQEDAGSLAALVKGLASPLDDAPEEDGELQGFLDSIERQDKDAEAAKVLSALESMAPSPDGEAYEGGDVSPGVGIAPTPDPDDLTTTGLTLKELFGLEADELEPGSPEPEAPAPPQDPLAPRRLFADRRLYHFVRELVPNPETFAILRFLLTSGLDRLTLEELEGCLVQRSSSLKGRLDSLTTGGIMVVEGGRYSLNPRSRNALVLGQLVATWNDPGGRARIWGWFNEGMGA